MNFALKSLIVLAIVNNGFIKATVNSFYEKFANVSVPDDCETNADSEEIFGQRINYYSDDTGNVFCFRKNNGVVRMSSTSRPFEDPRFMCSNGPMSWYRGRRNVDFKNRPCLLWSSFPNSTFDISDSSSSSYSMKRILPDEYENFCRNPDENPLGPWCHVEGGLKVPCFEPCRLSSSDFVCLNRDGFPYTDVEMSDILDLPQLIGVFKNVHLMYESRFVIPIEVDRLSTKSCINKGSIASFFGPWIAVFDEIAKDFVKIIGRRVLRDLCAPIDTIEPPSRSKGIHHDAIIEDELTVAGCSFWRRCFSSCQDDLSTCWKKENKGYFGSKATTLSGKSCLPWTQVSSEILKMIKSNSTSYETFHVYHDLLFNDPSQFFVESRLFMNTESSCMLLHRRDDSDMRSSFTGSSSYTKGTWMTEFKKMFQEGPGCFVKHNKTLQFESCFSECEKTPEVVLTKPLCPEGNTYSICKPKRGDDWLNRGRKVD
ncbi:unnamed protein product [Caenorhabditis nigoni]